MSLRWTPDRLANRYGNGRWHIGRVTRGRGAAPEDHAEDVRRERELVEHARKQLLRSRQTSSSVT